MPSDILQFVPEVMLGAAYALIVFTVLKSQEKIFKNAIYILFAATGVADIFSIYLSIFFRVVGRIGVDSIFQRIISIALVVNGVTFMAHMVGNVFIAANRYSALCLISQYDMIWKRRNVWIIVGLQYVVASIAVSPLIGAEIVYTPNTDGTYTFAGLEKQADLNGDFVARALVPSCVLDCPALPG
ncbi:hypothetical protein GCK32_018309 [Trichostrongylus colubriformis]|uniref:Serpentine receptor class gamma n=1 Tax=Trichostrongylus colubriformis TaxID=6319 RepID=A0AAN8FUA9_TRICO